MDPFILLKKNITVVAQRHALHWVLQSLSHHKAIGADPLSSGYTLMPKIRGRMIALMAELSEDSRLLAEVSGDSRCITIVPRGVRH
ncbi:hypothetical protein DPMN_180881 [Dreissena polymorpha]|uniref:Uncharacterized protein n=1 Tax=Dreissena polymorpha TaxID=45954 RepID=A0A9D4DD65_DREPO|nr:hypothetical protein DPMN_180881 [Dreissena polymorpha]